MGQKVHPVGIRLGITKEWSSKWYASSQMFPGYVEQEVQFRFDNGVWNAHSRKRGIECPAC